MAWSSLVSSFFAGLFLANAVPHVNADEAAVQQQALADSADGDDDLSYADTEDFSSHAGVGDETVLNPVMAFVSDSATLAPALRSDDARQPPFLPLAGRPPRV